MARTRHPGSTPALAFGVGAQGLVSENEVELGRRLNEEIRGGEPVGVFVRLYGEGRVKVLRALPHLPDFVQELVNAGRLKATAAVQIAHHISDPQRLAELLQSADARVRELYTSGRSRSQRITLRMVLERQTMAKVVREMAAQLRAEPLPGGALLLDGLHGLLHGWNAGTILTHLRNGQPIQAPLVRKRGRARKDNTI
jgi:hypothetical protein